MFDKNYKQAMDSIGPSAELKERILDKIEQKEEIKSRKSPATPWRVAFACVACAAIVLGAIFVPKNKTVSNIGSENKTLSAAHGYTAIYNIFRNKKIIARFNNGYSEDEAYVEYATDNLAEDDAMPGETNGYVNKGTGSAEKDFSNTTEQVEGVSEADIVKTDGKYIYQLIDNYYKAESKSSRINIYSADRENSRLINTLELSAESGIGYGEMFLKDDRLILLQTNFNGTGLLDDTIDTADSYNFKNNYVSVLIFDISDPAKAKQITCSRQQGYYNTARMVGDYVYLISNCNINIADVERQEPESFVPTTVINDVMKPVPAGSIYRYSDKIDNPEYAVVGAYNYKDGTLSDTVSLLGGTNQIYCSSNNIILTKNEYHDIDDLSKNGARMSADTTVISRLEINNGKIEYKASGEIDGQLENQFFIDEYKEHFRFVTTVSDVTVSTTQFANTDQQIESYSSTTSARLTVLDGNLEKTGEIKDLAPDERVYSVRFMGDTAYFVTFRQVDPLFSADLSDPANPKIIGKLKIPGFSEYMYPYGDGMLLGFGQDADESTGRTGDLKLSMFDISDPANVSENNKSIIDGYNYSPALYDHKAMLVSKDKNLIGFLALDDYGREKYLIYSYDDGAFVLKATLDAFNDEQYFDIDVRGIFINDGFYVISYNSFKVFDINDFSQLTSIEF